MIYFLIFILVLVVAYFAFTRTGSKLSPKIDTLIQEVLDEPLPELIHGETGEATSNGVSLFYESINHEQDPAQETILLINGHTQTMLDWPQDFIASLTSAGHHVIRFDNRGIGMSDWMPNWNAKSNSYVLEDLAKDALSVLDALGIKHAHIVGQSMGGMIGQRLAISHGERLKSLTSIMSTGHYHDPQLVNIPKGFYKEFIRLTFRYMFGLKKLTNKLKLHLEVRYALDGSGDYQVNEKQILQKARYEIEQRRGYHMKATDQHSHAIKASPSRYEGLKKLSLPVLVVHGTTDPLVTFEHAQKYAPMIPEVETMFIEGMGHDLPSVHTEKITTGINELINRAK